MPDNIAIQSEFQKNVVYPEFCSLQIIIEWLASATDKQVQSINFVVLEPKKNWWHNNNKANFQIPIALSQTTSQEQGDLQSDKLEPELLSLGK